MTDTPPDRLSSNPNSPFYDEAVLARDVGIRFNGVEKTNVDEYCVSEGWIRVTAGASKDRFGNPMTIKLKGKVEPYFRARNNRNRAGRPSHLRHPGVGRTPSRPSMITIDRSLRRIHRQQSKRMPLLKGWSALRSAATPSWRRRAETRAEVARQMRQVPFPKTPWLPIIP
jgi:hypothetical protein